MFRVLPLQYRNYAMLRRRALLGLPFLMPLHVLAQSAAAEAPKLNAGDTAWMLVSVALVLFMTIPGLSLFYGGLVRSKNVLSVMAQCVGIACLASVLWLAGRYRLGV